VAGLRPDAAVERSGQRTSRWRGAGRHSTILIGRDGGAIVANRPWSAMTAIAAGSNYVATDPDRRGKGFGRAIMNAARLACARPAFSKLHCWSGVRTDKAGAFINRRLRGSADDRLRQWLDGRTAT